jgi:hypothetical protein
LKDLFPKIREKTEDTLDITPQLYLGETLPEFGFVKNKFYCPREETLTNGQKEVLLELWNNWELINSEFICPICRQKYFLEYDAEENDDSDCSDIWKLKKI